MKTLYIILLLCATLAANAQAPTSDFTISNPICVGSTTTVTYTGNGQVSDTYDWDFGSATIFSGSGQGPYVITCSAPGVHDISLTVTGPGGTSPTTTNALIVYELPTSDFTATSSACTGDTIHVQYTGTYSMGCTCIWDFDGATIVSGTYLGPYNILFASPGTYNISMQVVDPTTGCVSNITTHQVGILTIPIPDAGPDQTVCGYQVDLSAITIYPGYWTSAYGDIYFSGMSAPVSTVLIMPFAGSSHNQVFTWHENNGACEGTDAVNITFIKPPNVEAGLSQATCDTSAILTADTLGLLQDTAYWTSWPGVYINDPSIPNPEVGIGSLIPAIYGDSSRVRVPFIWNVLMNGNCHSIDTAWVTFYEMPHAYAGPDDSTCGLTYQMQGQASIPGSYGIWSYCCAPGTATFLSVHSDTSMVLLSIYGPVNLIWTEMNEYNTTCEDRDTTRILFLQVPTVDAGSDFSVCGHFANLIATTSTGIGTWISPGTATWWTGPYGTQDPNLVHSPNTWLYWSAQDDTITAVWEEYNGICVARDSVHVYFGAIIPAVELVSSGDTTNCGLTFNNLNAQPPMYGHGYWTDSIPGTTFYSSDTINPASWNPNPDSVLAASYGMHHFYWITANGACQDTSDVVPVKFLEIPQAHITCGHYWPLWPNSEIKSDTTCGYSYILDADPSVGVGNWYVHDNTQLWFLDSIGLPSAISYEPNDTANTNILTYNINPPFFEFIWTENNGGCIDSDTLYLAFLQVANINGNAQFPAGVNAQEFGAEIFPGNNIYSLPVNRSSLDAAGNFSVNVSQPGDYFLKITKNNPATWPAIANTYYNDEYLWENAQLINLSACGDTFAAGFPAWQMTPAAGGQCRAWGFINYDGSMDPVVGADVYLLYKPSITPAILVKTNASGYYSLDNIPQGNYKIQVDIAGLPQITTHHITVNPNDTAFQYVNFIVDTSAIAKDYGFGIYADSTHLISVGEKPSILLYAAVYPNPCTANASLYITLEKESSVEIILYDQHGREIWNRFYENQPISSTRIELPIADLLPGIYYVKATAGNTVYVKKLVKE